MRLKIRLIASGKNTLTANYNPIFSSLVNELLKINSPTFSNYLETNHLGDTELLKNSFSFALRFYKINYRGSFINLISPCIDLFITTPIKEDYLQARLDEAILKGTLETIVDNTIYRFEIDNFQVYNDPEFSDDMRFYLLSPIVLSEKIKTEEKTIRYFYRYTDSEDDINVALNRDLIRKFELITGTKYFGKEVLLHWDENYISQRTTKGKRLTKKINFPNLKSRGFSLIGNLIPFSIIGDPRLIKIGYMFGFGEENSLGFGLASVARKIAISDDSWKKLSLVAS